MDSNRILLSDKHSHDIRLTEQSMSIIYHGLDVLMVAFQMEPQYHQLIKDTQEQIQRAYDSPVIKSN